MFLVATLADAPAGRDTESDEDESAPDEADAARMTFLNAREPALRELAAIVLESMRQVDWVAAAQSLESKKKYELHDLDVLLCWLSQLSTDITDEIASALSTDWLLQIMDEATQEEWFQGDSFGAIANLLYHLSWGERGEATVRAFVDAHEDGIESFPSILVKRYPDLAARWINRGARAEVRAPHGSGWRGVTKDLKAVAETDRNAAVIWLGHMSDEFVTALSKPQKHDLAGVERFIRLADELDATVLDAVISRVDVESARVNWAARWEDSQDTMRGLLQRVSNVPGAAADLAESIMMAGESEECNRVT